MRIALTVPHERESASARQCAELALHLPAVDCEVELTQLRGAPAADALAVRRLLERCGELDVIHDHAGLFPQLSAAGAPVVVTLHVPPAGDARELLLACGGDLHLVAEGEAIPGIACFATLPPAEGAALAGSYRRVYADVIGAARVKRADTTHDRRPWGQYWVLADEATYKVKRIDVLPGKRLSYQSHRERSEHWTVVSGRARVTLDGAQIELGIGESVNIPAGCKHRVENPGSDVLTFVEVQHGRYFGEDDIVRYDDDFGRLP